MKDFIEEFYYGNIDPQARSTRCNKAVSKEMSVLSETEEYLTNKLKDEEKSKFLEKVNTKTPNSSVLLRPITSPTLPRIGAQAAVDIAWARAVQVVLL